MSKMCPISGCKGKPGLCLHEKVMLGVVVIVIIVGIVKVLGLY